MAFAVLASACSSSLYDKVKVREAEVSMWNDVMPGKKSTFNATLSVRLENASREEIVLSDAEGVIAAFPNDIPLRRFVPLLLVNDQPVKELHIHAESNVECRMRTPIFGVPPIDTTRTPLVQFLIRFLTPHGETYLFKSQSTRIHVTQ